MFITNLSVRNDVDGIDNLTVTSDRTVRSIFDEAGLNYSRGMLQFDGAIIPNSALDDTIETLTDDPNTKHVLRITVKAENAVDEEAVSMTHNVAAAVINGGALVITSTATPEELKMLKKYRPEALKLYVGEGAARKQEFMVDITKAEGCVSQMGVVFTERTNAAGMATVTVMIPDDVTDAKAWAEDYLGVSILKLRKTEAQFAGKLAEVKHEKEDVAASITIA